MDIRLKTYPLEFDGKHYELAVNMNVLADLQELNNGNLAGLLDDSATLKTTIQILTACLNDYAEYQHWTVQYTPKAVGRMVGWDDLESLAPKLRELVIRAVAGAPQPEQDEDAEKKAATRENEPAASTLPGT